MAGQIEGVIPEPLTTLSYAAIGHYAAEMLRQTGIMIDNGPITTRVRKACLNFLPAPTKEFRFANEMLTRFEYTLPATFMLAAGIAALSGGTDGVTPSASLAAGAGFSVLKNYNSMMERFSTPTIDPVVDII